MLSPILHFPLWLSRASAASALEKLPLFQKAAKKFPHFWAEIAKPAGPGRVEFLFLFLVIKKKCFLLPGCRVIVRIQKRSNNSSYC
jgi:hypothetical protein